MKKSSCEQPKQQNPLLVILSGPSGAGKDAVIARMKELECRLERIVTVTTRPIRAGEKDHVDYHFVSPQVFQSMVERGEFLESAQVYGNYYGVPGEAVRSVLSRGGDAIIKIDVQGAATLKKILPEAIYIFLVPPSTEELITRLKSRDTESPQDMALRLQLADKELKQLNLFDYIIVNKPGRIDQAVAEIKAIITTERCRVVPRHVKL